MFKRNLHKALALLASVVILCTVLPLGALFSAGADVEGNLVVNGDFESGKDGWSCNSGTAEIVADANSGSSALQLTNPTAWGEAAVQTVNVTANTDYKLVWYSKRVSGKGAFNLIPMNPATWLNIDSTGQNWMNETSGNWVKNEITIHTGSATQVFLKFTTEGANAGSIIIDDIVMTQVGGGNNDQPSEAIEVVNGDFETGDNTGWEAYHGSAVKAEAKHDGEYGMHLIGNGSWDGIAFQDIPVQSGTEYTVKMWLKAVTLGVNIQIKDGGFAGAMLANKWFDATEWTLLEFKVTPTTDKLHINFCGSGKGSAESVYLDDVTVTGPAKPGDIVIDVNNGDFETGDNTGWEVYHGSAVKAEAKHDGEYGMHLIGNGSWDGIAFQDIPVISGKEYTVKMWLKTITHGVNIQIKDGGFAGAELAHQWFDATEWTLLEFKVTPTNDKLHINFCGSGKGSAESVYLDDISVTAPGDNNSSVVNFVNGDFETGSTDGWTVYQGTAVKEEAKHGGSYGLHLTGNGGWGGMAYQDFAVEAGNEYTITMWAKAIASGANIQIKDGGSVSGTEMDSKWFTSTDWTPLAFTVIPTTDKLGINICGGGNGIAESVYLDDVVVTVKLPDEPSSDFVNGGFEQGEEGWTLNSAMATIVDGGHDSAKALQLANLTQYCEAAIQSVVLEANTDYTLTWYSKRVEGSGPVNVFPMSSSNGNLIIVKGQSWMDETSGEWVKNEIVITTGEDATVKLKFSTDATTNPGIVLIDDVSIAKYEPSADFVNGGFEQGEEGWTLNSAMATIVDGGHDSAKALQLANLTQYCEAAIQSVVLKANTDYTLTWYSKRVEGSGPVNVFPLSSSNGNLAIVKGQSWMDETSGEWVKNEIIITTGEDATVKLKFSTDATTNPGIVLIDDVSIAKYEPGTPSEPEFPPIEENQLKNGGFDEGTTGWNWKDPTKLDDQNYLAGNACALLDNDKEYGEALTQTIALRPDTDYVIIFYTKRQYGSGAWSLFLMDASSIDSGNVVNMTLEGTSVFKQAATEGWVKTELWFNSGTVAEALLKFAPAEDKAGTFWLDNVGLYVKGYAPEGDLELEGTSSLQMTSFGVVNNRPMSADKNLLQNGDFESTGGQWDVDTFHTEYVSVVDDSTAKFGSKTLFFNTSALDDKEKNVQPIFFMELQPNTDYVFSAWLKGARLSEDNRGRATIGVTNENGKFLSSRDYLFLEKSDRQLVPTAWDDQWHLRSVQFNTGSAPEGSTMVKVGIALSGWGSKMWIDDMALFVVGDGTKYMSANMAGGVKLDYSFNRNTIGCSDADCLIPDPNMKKADESGFWAGSYGWRNGFVSFVENRYEYGASMKYTSTGDEAATYMIKWVDVEPNTQYTFAVDIKILEDGFGRLGLLDDKKRDKVEFFKVSFDSYDYDDPDNTGWRTVVTSFNTDVYSRIGIAIVDDGGEVLLDNMRLFKTANAKHVEDYYIAPPSVKEDVDTDGETDEDQTEEEQETIVKKKKKVKSAPTGIDPMLWVWIGAGSAVALAGAAVTIILLINKRKKAAAAAAAAAAAEQAPDEPTPDVSAE